MATFKPSILNGSNNPDTSNNIWWESGGIAKTNAFFREGLWRFKNSGSSKIKLGGRFSVPANYNSSGTTLIIPKWTTTATSNSIVWGFEYRVVDGDDTTSLDQATAVETVSVTDAAPGAAWRQLTPSMTLVASNISGGATLQYNFYRDKSSGSDTLAADGFLVDLIFSYTD